MPTPDLELIYVGDPMCSWCWGFSPVLERMAERYTFQIRMVMGGLRPGDAAEALDEKMKRFLAHHWHQVEETTGQGFDHRFFQRDASWRYDTELPCIATVTMRELDEKSVIPFYTRLQRAFYAENTDITDVDVYPSLLEGFSVDHDQFVTMMQSDEMRQRTWQDFTEARRIGANGFPTLLIRDGDDHLVVTRGYVPYEQLEPALTGWIEDRFPSEAEGLVCAIDGDC